MSGRKTTYTSISVDELIRLRRQACQASSLSQCNQALQQLAERSEQLMRQQQSRIDSLNSTINGLNRTIASQDAAASRERQQLRTQLQTTIQNTNQALQQMAARSQQQMQELSQQFRQDLAAHRTDTARAIEESNRRMDQALQSAVSSLESQIGTVSSRMDRMEQDLADSARRVGILFNSNASLLELAREYADVARTIADDTARNFRTELLLPGRLEQVQELLRTADQDIRDADGKFPTNAPVARQSARTAATAAMQLHEDMVRAEQAWQARYQAAVQALNAAEAQIEACRRIRFPGETAEIDVDRWSNGDLSALSTRQSALRGQLNNADGLSVEALYGIRQAGAQLASEVLETSEFAAIAFGASQDRADVAQDVADSMRESLGLMIVDHGFQSGDQRAAHRIHLKNPHTGFEMVVTQYPETGPDGVVGNRLESDILDYGTNNEQEGDRIAYQALSALSGLGLCQQTVQTVPGYENRPSDRRQQTDMAAWRHQEAELPCPVHTQPAGQTAVN